MTDRKRERERWTEETNNVSRRPFSVSLVLLKIKYIDMLQDHQTPRSLNIKSARIIAVSTRMLNTNDKRLLGIR